MGVTIHFEGRLKSEKAFEQLTHLAISFADEQQLPYLVFKEENKLLPRVKDEADWDYQGPVKEIKILLHENADYLWLEFDENFYIQEFCKTQFAEPELHMLLVGFLRSLQQYFAELTVFDEGEYWDTNDRTVLEQHLDYCFRAMENRKMELPKVSGPHRMEDGRIIDLIVDGGD
ncbi:MAG: hypothetical protein JWP58_2329 [Hymenobacter sp.]|nr:hypothetical protein [Hymenobacter sp.]